MPRVTAAVSKVTNRQSLVQGCDYDVIALDDEYIRIVDQCGEPALYPRDYFLECDIAPPEGWVVHKSEDGEYHAFPPELDRLGLFEDYADGCSSAIELFKEYCRTRRIPL